MRLRISIVTALGALALCQGAAAWDDVNVFVTFPTRVTAGHATVLDFHVMLGQKALDLSTVGPRDPSLRPVVVFRHGSERVVAIAHKTLRPGVYRIRVALPNVSPWRYSFDYAELVRTFTLHGATR
jgi:hypothetical protein